MPLFPELNKLAEWANTRFRRNENAHSAWKILTPIRWALTDLNESPTPEIAVSATRNIWKSLPDAVVSVSITPEITVWCQDERLALIPTEERINWTLLEVDEYAARIATALNTTWKRTVFTEE